MKSAQRDYLETIRQDEINCILSILAGEQSASKEKLVVLEIGAGAGWQAKKIAEHGYLVEAIDIEGSGYSEDRVWPVKKYDGRRIPFSNGYFDVVFSSNVLEHIAHIEEFQKEILRVLKTSGIAVHVVPGSGWRFWTSIAHYPFIIKSLLFHVKKDMGGGIQAQQAERASIAMLLKNVLFPHRHGEIGNSFSELYRFSIYSWKKMFIKNGWKIERIIPNNLFYTGYMIFGSRLPLNLRRQMSRFLGNACYIFILKSNSL
jgi:SAM-dependent methyltransferase